MNNQTRITLKSDFTNAKEVIFEVDRLTAEFKTLYKRNSDVQLFLSQSGNLKDTKYELVAYYDSKDSASVNDIDHFKESLASQYNK